jgi:pilus assembly protein CpaF
MTDTRATTAQAANAQTTLTDDIASRVRARVSQTLSDSDSRKNLIDQEITRVAEQQLATGRPFHEGDEATLRRQLDDTLTGLGPLQPYLDDPSVEEIWINAPDRVFIAKAGVNEKAGCQLEASQVRDLVERMLRPTGRRIDVSQPFVDASLQDGSRVHVVIPDITRDHWSVNIRKFSRQIKTLHDLVARHVLPLDAAHYLTAAMRSGATILVSGATQAGKTTMLTALLHQAPPTDRVVSVEETFELDLEVTDHVGLQCRGPSLEGTGEVTLRRLVKEALRMRPDRIVVGEVREAEALDLLIALNSGLPGACTIHARSGSHALDKLCMLPLLAGANIDRTFVTHTVANVIDLVVHVQRGPDGVRRVTEIVRPTGLTPDGTITTEPIFDTRSGTLERVPENMPGPATIPELSWSTI